VSPTHYSPAANGDVLDYIVQKNIQLSEVIVSDIQDSDYLPIIFHLLDHIRSRNLLDPVDKFTDWEQFQILASQLISHRIQINSGEKADKLAPKFTASIALVYNLSTSKIILSGLNKDLPSLESPLKHMQNLRKLWQVTWDPLSKMADNWVAKTMR
jgi:hypothetical protein